MKIRTIDSEPRAFRLTWDDGTGCDLPYIWLRDNDPDELHPETRERVFDLTTVDLDIQPKSHRLEDDALIVQWPDREEASHYPARLLAISGPGVARNDPAAISPRLWDSASLEKIPRFTASECMASGRYMLQALEEAKRTGLVIFEGLDDDDLAGEHFGDEIGFKRRSNFGVMFEVLNKPSPNNLAYTALALPLHTDLPNQEIIPGYQFLHCRRNSATGGESIFADGFRVCAALREQHADHFNLLSRISIPWRFHDASDDVRSHRPIIQLDSDGSVACLAFNAHIADVPDMPADTLDEFYAAYQNLMQRIRSPEYRLRYALQPGEMVMFNNRRILHGREAFDPGSGDRYFRGYYIEHNEVDSRIRMLAQQ